MMIYYFNKLCKNLQEKFNDIYIIKIKKSKNVKNMSVNI